MDHYPVKKSIVFLSVLVYTLLAAGAVVEHCHTDKTVPGHEEHCQGCHTTHFTASPAKNQKVINTEHVLIDQVRSSPFLLFSLTPDAILHNRAPPC